MSTSSTYTRPALTDEERTLPECCPSWCNGQHAQELDEGVPIWEASQHRASVGEARLDDLCNCVDGRIWRPGGGRYDLVLEQDPHPTTNLGHGGAPLVRIILEDDLGVGHKQAEVRLTTGEARVLAAQLVSAADRVDIGI